MKKIITILSLTVACATLTACNTVSGVGKDVERGGEHVQKAAKNVQNDMRN
jgi:entericidin B